MGKVTEIMINIFNNIPGMKEYTNTYLAISITFIGVLIAMVIIDNIRKDYPVDELDD